MWNVCIQTMLSVLVIASSVASGCGRDVHRAELDSVSWRKVLDFDVMDTKDEHRADIDDDHVGIALWEPGAGWNLSVARKPVEKQSENLLAGDKWEGPQDWMVYAWMVNSRVFPDERVMRLGDGRIRVRISVVDCETRRTANRGREFARGRVRVYVNP